LPGAIEPENTIGGLSGMGDSPMWVEWHGRLARDSRGQPDAPPEHMGESPMPLDPRQFHGRVARATLPNPGFRVETLEKTGVAPLSLIK